MCSDISLNNQHALPEKGKFTEWIVPDRGLLCFYQGIYLACIRTFPTLTAEQGEKGICVILGQKKPLTGSGTELLV